MNNIYTYLFAGLAITAFILIAKFRKSKPKKDIVINFGPQDKDGDSNVIINGETTDIRMKLFSQSQVDKIRQAESGLSDEEWTQKRREEKLNSLLND